MKNTKNKGKKKKVSKRISKIIKSKGDKKGMKYLVKFNFTYYHADYFDHNKERDPKRDYDVYSTLIIKYEANQDEPFFDFNNISGLCQIRLNVKTYEIYWENEKEYTKDIIDVNHWESPDEDEGEITIYYRARNMYGSLEMTHPIPIDE